jgi:hypothetical protein
MAADIARVSYDPTRHYRSLIAQQGRVTLEADNNEATMLEAEALRLETIDMVGPAGTPDNGYAVSSGAGPGGVTIGPGIFYLGGWRLELGAPVDLSKQPDWADAPPFKAFRGDLTVSLLVTEQSVSATEDQALREVALGGPDSAARSRLMQRFLRIGTDGTTCTAGAKSVYGLLREDGVAIDPYSLQLMSSARLQAGFVPGPRNTDPCLPAAAGGYLGADNQLIRVTVIGYNPANKTGRLLWGWNNASLLYRAAMTSASDPLTLTLTTIPVDQEHAPQFRQMVEILRTTTDLGDNNFIADGQGFVTAIAQAWSPDTNEIVLADPLPTAYRNNTDPLFVRLWQGAVDFEAGKPVALDATSGITVAITMDALPQHIAARPFWRFAVRPAMPQAIFPQRYQDAPQPPDGPRQWITDLAVISAQERGSVLLSDCRVPFQPLTKLRDCCCGVTMGPEEVAGAGGLQAVVDGLAGKTTVLSLRTGIYQLAAPLSLGSQHTGLTIEGCTGKVVLQATGTDLTPFLAGLIHLDTVSDLTLRRLAIDIPFVRTSRDQKVQTGILLGVSILSARKLTIDHCSFSAIVTSSSAFGAAIFVAGPTADVTLTSNAFAPSKPGAELFGVLALVVNERAGAELDQWTVRDNRFQNLACAMFCFAQLGLVRCTDNFVIGCGDGFIFAEANLGDTNYFTQEALTRRQDTDVQSTEVSLGQAANAALRPDMFVNSASKIAPVIKALPSGNTPAISGTARKALLSEMKSGGGTLYKRVAAAGDGGTAGTARTAKSRTAKIDSTSFDKLAEYSIAAELLEVKLTPALRIEDNEITLTARAAALLLGIDVILSLREPGSVIVSGNRVVVPDATAVACALLFPVGAVVTGNLFAQLRAAPDGGTALPSLIVVTESPAIMVSANVASYTEYIVPARASQAATTSWEFLETTG